MRSSICLPPLLALAAASPADWAAVRDRDARVGAIGYRLATANAALCRERGVGTGLTIHALGQYRPADRASVRAFFGFEGPVGIEAVAPASPAQAAGVEAGDTLVAVDGLPVVGGLPGAGDRDAAEAAIAGHGLDAPLDLTLRHNGADRVARVAAAPACRVTIETVLGGALAARSDGRAIQVGDGFPARYRDDEVAVVIAHELAHIVLGHHAALAGRGHDRAAVRDSEAAADRLSVTLLYDAGYDPASAARFWRVHGRDLAAGAFARRRHAMASERAVLLDRAAAAIPDGAPRPIRAPQ